MKCQNFAAAAAARVLPPLPPLPPPLSYRGPTPWSNWVIMGRVMAGAFPAVIDDAETETQLSRLLGLGIDTFVCLQAEFSLTTPEAMWRSGQALRPYVRDAQRLMVRAKESGSPRIFQDRLDFLHLPIIDGGVTSDHAISRLADDCCQRILDGERLYIHCWGGHGRTGTLVAVMLSRLYGLTAHEALVYTQALHDVRINPQGVRSPQTAVQHEQVKRLLLAEAPGGMRALSYRWPMRPLSASPRRSPDADAASKTTHRPPPPPPTLPTAKTLGSKDVQPAAVSTGITAACGATHQASHAAPVSSAHGALSELPPAAKGAAGARGAVIQVEARAGGVQETSNDWVAEWADVHHSGR